MKIAVQIFGHMRTFQKCAPILKKKILTKYDCDIFIHTWDKPYHNSNDYQDDFRSEIIKLYNPKKIKIDKQDFYNVDGQYIVDTNSNFNGYNVPLNGLKYMNYSMISANLLRCDYQKECGVKYDYILCVRPDIFLNDDFNIYLYENEFKLNINTLISFANYPILTVASNRLNISFLANDVFLLTTPFAADTLFSSISDFDKYYIKFPSVFPKNNFHPEFSFSEMIVGKNIIHRIYAYAFIISRKNPKDDLVISLDQSDMYLELSQFKGSNVKLKKYKRKFLFLLILFFSSLLINFYQILM